MSHECTTKAICDRMVFLSGSEIPAEARSKIKQYLQNGADPKRVERAFRKQIVKASGVHHRVKANRQTGTETMVADAKDYESDLTAGKYVTICCTHSTLVQISSLAHAKHCASYPDNFCDDCREVVQSRESGGE